MKGRCDRGFGQGGSAWVWQVLRIELCSCWWFGGEGRRSRAVGVIMHGQGISRVEVGHRHRCHCVERSLESRRPM